MKIGQLFVLDGGNSALVMGFGRDQFCAIFKEMPSFFCGVTPSKTLAAPQPLNIAFPLGNGGVLRSEEGEGFGKGGEGEKKRKKGRAKSAQ